jgi:transcriptional regulator with XRE-family HTH domain
MTRRCGYTTISGVASETKQPPLHPEFAARLEDSMRTAGITAKVIEEQLGVDDETVRLWRRGFRMPKGKNMDVLAKLLGKSAGYLRYGDEDASARPEPFVLKDDDERTLIELYRDLPDWGKKSVRARIVEIMENFVPAGPNNPYSKAKTRAPGTQ